MTIELKRKKHRAKKKGQGRKKKKNRPDKEIPGASSQFPMAWFSFLRFYTCIAVSNDAWVGWWPTFDKIFSGSRQEEHRVSDRVIDRVSDRAIERLSNWASDGANERTTNSSMLCAH